MMKPAIDKRQSQQRITVTTIALTALTVAGCASAPKSPPPPLVPQSGPPLPSENSAVLTNKTQLIAFTPDGRLKIEAGPGMKRVYTWDGYRRGAILNPRNEPFAGAQNKGIHFDGKPKVWAPAGRITRLDAEEGTHNFKSKNDAKIWMQIRRLYFTYNDSGLAVGWKRDHHTLHVELWQFYIDGKKPTTMPGAKDSAIKLGPLNVVPQSMPPTPYAIAQRDSS